MLTASAEGQRASFMYLLKVIWSHGSHAKVRESTIALVEANGESGGGHEVTEEVMRLKKGHEVKESYKS